MSTIEQAARRLEELRRPGADLPDPTPAVAAARPDTPPAVAAPGVPHATPAPEAVVRAIDAHRDAVRTAAPFMEPPTRRAPSTHPHQHVELDLVRLRDLGFITPDAPMNQ